LPWHDRLVPTTDGALYTRILVSPLAIAVSHGMGIAGSPRWVDGSEWQRELRAEAEALDLRPLAVLSGLLMADFLLPVPSRAGLTIRRELDAVRATPAAKVARDIASWDHFSGPRPAAYEAFETDPSAALAEYTGALEEFWDHVLAPRWPRMQRVLERSVLTLGHTLATEGVEAVMHDLHPGVSYDDGLVHVDTDHRLTGPIATAGRPLVLLPLVCGLDGLLLNDDLAEATVIAFPGRGVGELFGEQAPAPRAELVRLLGASRARIAVSLERPATTGDLAAGLGLAPSTVSCHLAWLAGAGLADRVRLGSRVYYRLTDRGEALLHLF
jgi:DNA-binding transcriptional ArsR family regulator